MANTNETGFLSLKTATGTPIPVRFGLGAIRRMCKHYGCKLTTLGEKIEEALAADQIDTMLVILTVGAETEAALNGVGFDCSEDELLSALDQPGAFTRLMEAFNGSFGAFSQPEAMSEAVEAGKPKAVVKPTAGGKSGGK